MEKPNMVESGGSRGGPLTSPDMERNGVENQISLGIEMCASQWMCTSLQPRPREAKTAKVPLPPPHWPRPSPPVPTLCLQKQNDPRRKHCSYLE